MYTHFHYTVVTGDDEECREVRLRDSTTASVSTEGALVGSLVKAELPRSGAGERFVADDQLARWLYRLTQVSTVEFTNTCATEMVWDVLIENAVVCQRVRKLYTPADIH